MEEPGYLRKLWIKWFGRQKKTGTEIEAEELAGVLSNRLVDRLAELNSGSASGVDELAKRIQATSNELISIELPKRIATLVEQDFLEKHAPNNKAETWVELYVYRMRWLLVLAYVPLAFLLLFIGFKIWGETKEAWNALACSSSIDTVKLLVVGGFESACRIQGNLPGSDKAQLLVDLTHPHAAYSHLVLSILHALDLILIGTLLVMVAISGYENSVSRLDSKNHHTGPTWLGMVDVGSLKVKVASSIIAISSIHLLAAFMAISPERSRNALGEADLEKVKWLIAVHATLVISALALAIIDKIAQHSTKHDSASEKDLPEYLQRLLKR
jgi:uncharacterized protein (TIGR00645 family)